MADNVSEQQDAEGNEQFEHDGDEVEQNEGFFLEDNDNHMEGIQELNADGQEVEDVALLDSEPADDNIEQHNESSLLEENGAIDDSEHKDLNLEDTSKALDDSKSTEKAATDKKKSQADKSEDADFEGNDDEDDAEEEEAKNRDSNEMPQVNVATLAKRKWQVKIYPLKPEDFVSGQISRVFSNARESLLYILSSGKYSGGKGEMYISSGIQASRVVQNLMKLDFKSPNINIEIIKKNDEGVVEEKAFMRFDAKLVRILCVPLLPSRRIGSKRERIIGSVFVKNLPKGTSKDMLRVMFPFAPEINYNPEKFQDGTARLVLSTRSAVVPCLKAFAKVELGDTLLEMRPLQKKVKSSDEKSGGKSHDESEIKKDDKEDVTGSKSESEDAKKDEKGSGDKRESSTKPSSKKSPASKSADAKKDKTGDKDPGSKTTRSHSGDAKTRNAHTDRDRNRRWRSSRDNRRDSGLQNRLRDRNRFRAGVGFGGRNRADGRRIRPMMQGVSGDVGINPGAAKEMILLQSQLSMAIKNQLSMLSQTQVALQHAKREAVDFSMSRDVAQGPSSLLDKRIADPYSYGQLPAENARRGQMKTGANRRQQRNRGRPRDKRDGEQLASLTGDYGYKRNAQMAGLQVDYGASAFGKRRNAGMAGRSEGPSWAEEQLAFGRPQASHFGYEQELEEREAEYRLQASQSNLNYHHGYRY